jgi:hypothetical protein
MIEARTRTVYFSPAAGRHFMTKRAAFHADAMSRLKDRHEPESIRDELVGGNHQQTIYFSEEQWVRFREVSDRYYRRFGKARRSTPHQKGK